MALLAATRHADLPLYGMNTFLWQEAEIAKCERTRAMIAESGYNLIR